MAKPLTKQETKFLETIRTQRLRGDKWRVIAKRRRLPRETIIARFQRLEAREMREQVMAQAGAVA